MNTVIVVEIVVGIVVLAAVVRFAVRDTRQRRGVTESTDAGEAPVHGGGRAAEQHPSKVADQREGAEAAEAATLSASSTAPEPPADAR